MRILGKLFISLVASSALASTAMAFPSLQLGPGDTTNPDWSYVNETWVYDGGSTFDLLAFANATKADGGKGDYAWDTTGTTMTAYLVASVIPDLGNVGGINMTISNDGGALSLVGSGYGTPPELDPNSLAPHGVYPTYYEIYAFQFDGGLTSIYDTQTGGGNGAGFAELFTITIGSLPTDALGVHFDLFTTVGTGLRWNDIVKSFAPFSHDAEYQVPEPATLSLLGFGLLLVGFLGRRSRRRTLVT